MPPLVPHHRQSRWEYWYKGVTDLFSFAEVFAKSVPLFFLVRVIAGFFDVTTGGVIGEFRHKLTTACRSEFGWTRIHWPRRSVQRALNRGESYHKLCRAVSYANFGKLRFKTEQHQQIWGECSLIANCVIYYNASILSNMLDYREQHGQDSDTLKRISPVVWQHINLYGRYEFKKYPYMVDMEDIVQELIQSKVIASE